MKNVCIIFLSFFIISVTALGLTGEYSSKTATGTEYLRIHIRADSNDCEAQSVKYEVRDRVVEFLTPLVAECASKEEAICRLSAALPDIEKEATNVLQRAGYFYGASAELTVESFPTRVYGEYLFPAGEYSALVLRLGRGEGDNWWCVVYPPLCFTGGENVVYKSKIQEIIKRFYTKRA